MRASFLLLAFPAVLAACGGATPNVGGGAGTTLDVLSGGDAMKEVKTAQAWLRASGHYHFHDTVEQRSATQDLSGLPAEMARAFNGQISLTADGDVAGDKQVAAVAHVAGMPNPIQLVESGCLGFDSTDGTTWFKGEQPRWLTRMVAPTMDDGLSAIAWHDLGATTHDNVAVHHLQATVTALGMSGGAPSPGATPPPGYDVQPTTADLWLRSADAAPLELDLRVKATMNLHQLAAGTPYAAAKGTATQELSMQASFSTARGGVTPPRVASATTDPVPQQVYSGFGTFGVQTDGCQAGKS
jgi:hypothetical protein